MTKKELYDFLKIGKNNKGGQFTRESYFKLMLHEIYDDIMKCNFPDNFSFVQKLYHYLNDDHELYLGCCEECGNRCKFKTFNTGYFRFCSVKCKSKNTTVKNKTSQTRKNWTNEQKQEFSNKISLSKLNVSDEQKQQSNKKREETNLKRYGCRNVSQNEDIQKRTCHNPNIDKLKETLISKYGSLEEFYRQRGIKISETYNRKSDEEKQNIKLKRKNTNVERYGCDCNMNFCETREKIIRKRIDTYGSLENYYIEHGKKVSETYNLKTDEEKQQIKTKIIETNNRIYGYDYYFQTPEFKDYMKSMNMQLYGVEHYTQSKDYHKQKCHKFYSTLTHETYDSSWEMILAEYCFSNGIKYEYQPPIHFKYVYNNKIHIYQPDFLIGDKLYEVKGDHFFKDGKMINPYDRTQDDLYESKHQCMLQNSIIILKYEDIEKIKSHK